MGFLNVLKNIGKVALKVAPIAAAPFTGGTSLLALGAGTGALSGALGGGGWKGALLGGGLGAIPGVGAGGAAASSAGKVGLKQLATGLAKGAAANFATGTATGLATGQGLGRSLAGGGQGALSGLGTTGTGGLSQAAKTIGTGVGANVFTNYLGNQFNPAARSGLGSFLPQTPGFTYTPGGTTWPGVGGVPVSVGSGRTPGAEANAAGRPGPTYPAGAAGNAAAAGTSGGGSTGQAPGGFWGTYGPLIAQGAGVAVGGLAGKAATAMAQKRSPEELAALQGAQGVAGQARQAGGQLLQQGQQYLQQPGQYFQTLLSGNRAAMSQAVAAPTAQITGTYRGAQRALDQAGIRGAARDVAVADLNRQRASQIAGLTTGIQPYAAEQLTGMGQNMMGLAPGLIGQAGNIYGGLLGYGAENRRYGRSEGEKTASAIGGLARDVGEVVFRKGQPAPSTAPTNTQTSTRPQGGTLQPPLAMSTVPFAQPAPRSNDPYRNVWF